jgi:hypothetical protein
VIPALWRLRQEDPQVCSQPGRHSKILSQKNPQKQQKERVREEGREEKKEGRGGEERKGRET